LNVLQKTIQFLMRNGDRGRQNFSGKFRSKEWKFPINDRNNTNIRKYDNLS
jgi:hypothetical protein